MMKKELRVIIRITIPLLAVVGVGFLLSALHAPLSKVLHFLFVRVYPVLTKIPEQGGMIFPVFILALAIFWLANVFGFGAFKYEYKDRAFEYLLSLPYSRRQLLVFKLRPRFFILFGLTILYEVLASLYLLPLAGVGNILFFLFDPIFFPFWVLFIFLSGFFLGFFEQKNWVALVSLLSFMTTFLVTLGVYRLKIWQSLPLYPSQVNGLCFGSALVLILFLLGVGFFRVYGRFDARTPALHSSRFVVIVLPGLVSLLLLSTAVLFLVAEV